MVGNAHTADFGAVDKLDKGGRLRLAVEDGDQTRPMYRGSFRQPVLVIEKLGMARIRAPKLGRSPVRNSQQLVDRRPTLALLDLIVPRPKSLNDDTSHALARGTRDGLCKPVGFWIFYIKAHDWHFSIL